MRIVRVGLPLLLLGLLLAAGPAGALPASAARKAALPWIQDDYPRAVALAKARKLPIFVENWAPW